MKTQLSEYLPDPAEETPPASNNGKRPVPGIMFAAILRDGRICHGAFRLWHLLMDMSRSNGLCWPGIRLIAATLLTSDQRVTRWRKKLVACGYLEVEVINKENAPASKKLGGFIYRMGEVPANDGQQTVDTFYRTLNTGRYNPDGKSWTPKTRQQMGDVTKSTQTDCTPQPPAKTLLARSDRRFEGEGNDRARSARRIDGEEDGKEGSGNKKPRMTRRAAEGRLSEIEGELKTLKARDANYGKRLAAETRDAIDWLEKKGDDLRTRDPVKARSCSEEAARRLANAPKVRGEMLPDAKNQLAALRDEQNKLKAWLYGNRP